MQKAILLNDLYETSFLEKYKKTLQAKLQAKVEEVDEYRNKKR